MVWRTDTPSACAIFAPSRQRSLPVSTQPPRSDCIPTCSPVLMTASELERGSMLLLDMTEDARILFDPAGCLAGALGRLRSRLRELGSKRIWLGNAWYWDLKPDYKPGDVFDLFAP